MKKTALIIAAMCAVICAGAVGCNGNNDSKEETLSDTSPRRTSQLRSPQLRQLRQLPPSNCFTETRYMI